jgi:epoxyqueuosine reductase
MDADQFREVFRRSPVTRTKLAGFKRNVAIAIGNSGDESLLPSAQRLEQDEDPEIASHGRWAAQRLQACKKDRA